MTKANSKTIEPSSDLPLFYKNPVLLRFEEHRNKALKPENGFGFSAGANAVPLLVGEFVQAARFFPIVFSSAALARPMAVLGLKEGQNLFPARTGFWKAGTYIPAYLRRYPFIVTDFTDQNGQLLAIDAASDRFTDIGLSDDAEPFLDEKGGPSRMTAEAMAFCNAFHQDHLRGEKFGAALLDQGLLVHRHANMKFPDNSRYTLDGFQVVDEEKFRSLSDPDLLLDWHQKGWLAAITLHLASMNNWETLLLLNAEQNTAEQGAA